jgi:hypothetical protein
MTGTLHQTAPIKSDVIVVRMTDAASKEVSDKSPNIYFMVGSEKVWIETVNPVHNISGLFRLNLTTKLPSTLTAGLSLSFSLPTN